TWHGVIGAFHHACVSKPAHSGIHVWHETSDGLRPRHRGGEEMGNTSGLESRAQGWVAGAWNASGPSQEDVALSPHPFRASHHPPGSQTLEARESARSRNSSR